MPKKGYASITVSNEIKVSLEELAEKHQESVPDAIKRLLKTKEA